MVVKPEELKADTLCFIHNPLCFIHNPVLHSEQAGGSTTMSGNGLVFPIASGHNTDHF